MSSTPDPDEPSPRTVSADGVTLPLPAGWHVYQAEGAILALAETDPQGPLPARVVVTAGPRDPDGDPVEWFRRCRAELDDWCRHLAVVDLAEAAVAGRRARRLVATHAVVGVGGVVLDQWLVPDADRGVVLSCTAPALAYDTHADVFAGVATATTIGQRR